MPKQSLAALAALKQQLIQFEQSLTDQDIELIIKNEATDPEFGPQITPAQFREALEPKQSRSFFGFERQLKKSVNDTRKAQLDLIQHLIDQVKANPTTSDQTYQNLMAAIFLVRQAVAKEGHFRTPITIKNILDQIEKQIPDHIEKQHPDLSGISQIPQNLSNNDKIPKQQQGEYRTLLALCDQKTSPRFTV